MCPGGLQERQAGTELSVTPLLFSAPIPQCWAYHWKWSTRHPAWQSCKMLIPRWACYVSVQSQYGLLDNTVTQRYNQNQNSGNSSLDSADNDTHNHRSNIYQVNMGNKRPHTIFTRNVVTQVIKIQCESFNKSKEDNTSNTILQSQYLLAVLEWQQQPANQE